MVTSLSKNLPEDIGWEDKLALRQLVEQYFHGVDHKDLAAVADCFASDCFFQINVEPPVKLHGREAVRTMFSENAPILMSNHSVSHHTIQAEGNRLIGITYAVAHLLIKPADAKRILIRGLRYDDEYIREEGRWRIARRIHNPLWQTDAVSTPLGLS